MVRACRHALSHKCACIAMPLCSLCDSGGAPESGWLVYGWVGVWSTPVYGSSGRYVLFMRKALEALDGRGLREECCEARTDGASSWTSSPSLLRLMAEQLVGNAVRSVLARFEARINGGDVGMYARANSLRLLLHFHTHGLQLLLCVGRCLRSTIGQGVGLVVQRTRPLS